MSEICDSLAASFHVVDTLNWSASLCFQIARKHSKKIESKIPGSPKRAPKQRQSAKPKIVTKSQDKENTDSLERPVRVVVQPPSDNLLATDTCSSLSSLWLPVPDSGAKLPMVSFFAMLLHFVCRGLTIVHKGHGTTHSRRDLVALRLLRLLRSCHYRPKYGLDELR